MKLKLNNSKTNGQVALIVLLISAVVMTLGLSAARKTVVDTRVETDQEQLKQAFNAAESGIEYYLGTGKTNFTSVDSASSAEVSVTNLGEGTTVNFDQFTLVNTNLEFWLVGHNGAGNIDMTNYYRGSILNLCVKTGYSGGFKIDYFYNNGGYKVKRFGNNVNDSGYVTGYSDVAPVQGGCETNYREVSLTANTPLGAGTTPLLLVIKPLKNGASIYLKGDGQPFPVQGVELTSTGKVGDVSASVNRKLNVSRTYKVPGFALDAITTFGSVLSN